MNEKKYFKNTHVFLLSIFAFCLIFAYNTSLVYAGNDADYFEGKGTVYSPFLIYTADDLYKLSKLVNIGNDFENKYFRLENDIDLSKYCSGEGWLPIGGTKNDFGTETIFLGNFDGNNNEITNLYINRPIADNQGLFGKAGAVISDLTIYCDITGNSNVGGLCGTGIYQKIVNCNVLGSINGNINVGGISGKNDSKPIYNSSFSGSISGVDMLGGIIGYSTYGTISNCSSDIKMESDAAHKGGIVGYSGTYGNIYNCNSICDIKEGEIFGGIVGAGDRFCILNIENCKTNVKISNTKFVGGIVGKFPAYLEGNYIVGCNTYCEMINCETKGEIIVNDSDNIYIVSCYSKSPSGNISAEGKSNIVASFIGDEAKKLDNIRLMNEKITSYNDQIKICPLFYKIDEDGTNAGFPFIIEEHKYFSWQTSIYPTCASSGEKFQECAYCYDRIYESIEPLGDQYHEYNDWIIEKESTSCIDK